VSQDQPTKTSLLRQFSTESVGYALAAVIVLSMLARFGVQLKLGAEHSRVMESSDRWSKVMEDSAGLSPLLAAAYASGIRLAATGEPDARPQAAQARRDFENRFASLTAEIRAAVPAGDSETVLEKLAATHEAAEALMGQMDALTTAASPSGGGAKPMERGEVFRVFEQRYRAAIAACDALRGLETNVAIRLIGERDNYRARAGKAGWILGGLSVSLIFLAFTYFRLRNRRIAEKTAEGEELMTHLLETEVKYRSIFDNAIEGIFHATPEGQILAANPALAKMYGYESPKELMESMPDVAMQLYVDASQRHALLQALQEEEIFSNFEFEVARVDGRVIWVRENVHAVRDEQGNVLYLEGTVEDISGLWWGEQRRRLLYNASRVVADAASVEEARPQLLRAVCESLEWDMGAVWDVDAELGVLRCVEVWHTPEIPIEPFEVANAAAQFPLGQGLAGEVWRTREPKWIANLLDAPVDYPNASIALECGMTAAFGVPIEVNGTVKHILEFFSPNMSIPDHELLQTLGVISTQLGHLLERKRDEEALRRSEVRKAAIFRSAFDCIISFDEHGRISECNPAAERVFGFGLDEALGRDIADLLGSPPIHNGELSGVALYQITNAGVTQGQRVEMRAYRQDNAQFPVEVAISSIQLEGSQIFTAYVHDITERKDAERITSELAAVVANSNDAIVGCTLEGVVVSWNLGAERIYGYAADEVIGRRLHLLIPAERLDELPHALSTVKLGDSLASYETIRMRKDGRRISVSLTDSPIRGESGKITGLSSIARDITERKRLEEELLQSKKMDAVGRLAGGIAHDFNNILTAILGYSDLLIGQIDERQWMYKHLTEIRKAADFAASLTHQLLAFSRRQPLYLRVFNMNDAVRTMQKMLERVIGEDIKIKTRLNAEIGRLKADPSQIEQVLLNLCVNARDAMPKGGTITIETADVTYFLDDFYSANEMPAGDYVKLTVADTGAGIPAEVQKQIFEPFFTTKEKGQGTGLGLATCYGIVKQSGGYISVDSTVGIGTSFSIYLPRVDETGEKSSARKEIGQLPGGNETVLYVEDEITVRSLTAHVLRRLGYTVLEAGDGKQARDMVEHSDGREVHLLFSDVVLPDAGGKDLADWIKGRNCGTKILFTSGYIDEGILKRHGLESDTAFLQKPFTPADLARKVRDVIDGDAA
jgi:two-component system cell cycle sensor histidine kinase/response regulator CckA